MSEGGTSPPASATSRNTEPTRIAGLDTLRFIAAAVVAIGHLGAPPLLAGLERTHPIAWFISASYGILWNGPAAVIVFFVISGLCIHWPTLSRRPRWPEYFIRRWVRIGIPLLASIAVSSSVGIPYVGLSASILWSLQCELVYYTIYPLLLALRDRFGWRPILAFAFAAATATIVLVDPRALAYPAYGWALQWVVGLPCWILGCLLAERLHGRPAKKNDRIWLFRLGVWLAASVALALRFHSPIGYPWTLNAFSLLVYAWLLVEIPHLAASRVPRLSERLGLFSYSIYLVHLAAWEIYKKYYHLRLGYLVDWALLMGLVLVTSYVFFLACESPSQKLARRLAALLRRAPSAEVAPSA